MSMLNCIVVDSRAEAASMQVCIAFVFVWKWKKGEGKKKVLLVAYSIGLFTITTQYTGQHANCRYFIKDL